MIRFFHRHPVLSVAAALAATALTGGLAHAQTYTATIGGAQQTVKGWGFTPNPHIFNEVNGARTTPIGPIYDTVYDLQPSFIRAQLEPETLSGYFPNASIPENVIQLDQNRLTTLTTIINASKAKGASKYILSTWSPPAPFKTNNSASGYFDTNQNGQKDPGEPPAGLLTNREQAFCDYYAKVLNRIKDSAGLPVAISIQNEPGLGPRYDGCQYDGPDGWEQWRRVVKLMRATLDANGLSAVKIFAPESENYASGLDYLGTNGFSKMNYPQNDPLKNAIGPFGWHSYGSSNGSIAEMTAGRDAFPGREAWMTEYCPLLVEPFDETTWAIKTAQRLASDLVDMKIDYWAFWRAHSANNPDAGSDDLSRTLTYKGNANTAPTLTKQYHVLHKLWNTVRPGWDVRPFSAKTGGLPLVIRNTTYASGVDMVAFSNDTTLVILVTNGSAKDIQIKGIDRNGNGQLRRFLTDAGHDSADMGVTLVSGNQTVGTVRFPSKSVTILISEVRGAVPDGQSVAPSGGIG